MDGFGDYDNVLLQTDLDNEEENQHKLEQTSIQNSLMQSFLNRSMLGEDSIMQESDNYEE